MYEYKLFYQCPIKLYLYYTCNSWYRNVILIKNGQQVHQILHYIVSNKCFYPALTHRNTQTKTDTQTHTLLHMQYLYSLTNINYIVHVYCDEI